MRHYADREYLHARIHAMRGRLLTLKDYVSMVRDPGPFRDIADGAHDPVEAKETVFQGQMTPIIRIAGAAEGYTPLFASFLRQYEASNAKLLMAKAFGRPALEQWYDIGPWAVLDRSLLRENLSPKDLRMVLAGTYLDGAIEDISSLERFEIRLDILSAENLYRSCAPFPAADKEALRGFVLRRVAVVSLIRQWRLKESYHWSEERIRHSLETFHGLFGGLVQPQVKIVEEALNACLELRRKGGSPVTAVEDIEHLLEQYFHRWASSVFHRDFHSLSCVVAYLWLLSCQVRNLFRILDGLRFGLVPEAILERIVGEA